jgi:hypothetical protein
MRPCLRYCLLSPLARLSQYVDALRMRDMCVCDQQKAMPGKKRRMMMMREVRAWYEKDRAIDTRKPAQHSTGQIASAVPVARSSLSTPASRIGATQNNALLR